MKLTGDQGTDLKGAEFQGSKSKGEKEVRRPGNTR